MKKTILFLISLSLSAFSYAKAVTHDLADLGVNICDDSGAGQLDGTVYRCSTGSLTLRNGDSVIYSGNSGGKPITLEVMHGDIMLKGNNSVGSKQQRINLKTSSASSSLQVMKPSENKKKDSNGHRDIGIKNGSTVWGDIYAHNDVTIQNSVIRGNITSDGGDVTTKASGNKIFGNVTALHAVTIKQALVCGTLESKGHTVTVKNSKSNGKGSQKGVFALRDAIKSHRRPVLKQADICGSINPTTSPDKQSDIYCGVNEPDCDYAPNKCPVLYVKSICGWDPEPEPEPLPEPKQCIDVEVFEQESDLEKKWATMGYFSGDYDGQDGAEPKPFIHKNRLRITNNVQGQAAVGAYNYIFPSSNNIVEVEFDHFAYDGNRNNTGADGVAIVFSDASVLPSTGAFGGPLGYGVKPDDGGIEGFAGGWIAFGIDEYGNFSNEGSYYQDKNPLDSSPGQNDHSITIRGSGEKKGPGEYIDTSNHRIGTFPEGWFGGYRFIKKNSKVGKLDDESKDEIHRYRMTIDSRAIDGRDAGVYVSIKRASYQGNLKVDVDDRGKLKSDNLNWEDIIDSFNIMQGFAQSTAPSEFRVSVAGSTGLVKNVHEIDNFQICADEFQPLTEGIHHFEFDYSGVGSTCQPSDVILRACMDKDCDTLYPGSITDAEDLQVTLSPSAGHEVANWVQSSPISFKGSTHLQLQGAKAGFVTIGIANTHGVHQFGFEDTRCRINGDELSAEKCKIEFHGNTLSIVAEDVIANKESSDSNYFEFCSSSSATNTTRDIKLSMTYDVAPKEQPSVTLNYKKSDGNSTPVWSSDQTISGPEDDPAYLRDVYFDNNGRAKFKFTYPEAGKVSFNASVEGIEDSKGVGTFVSYPHRLQATASGRCGSKSGCDRGFIAAGEEFTISITALQYSEDGKGGMPAKNYKEEQMVVSNEVVYPAISAGGKKAELLTDTYQHIASDDAKTSFSQTVSEVGAFKFSISAPEGNVENTSLYLSKSSFLIQPATITLGRFYPKFYKLRGQHWDYAGSQSFNYMNQNFDSMWYEVEVLAGGDAPKSVENYKYFNKEHVASFELSDSLNRFNAQGNLTPSWVDALGSIQRFTLTPPLSGKCNAIEGLCWMKKTPAAGYEDGPFNLNGNTIKATDIKVGVAIEPDPISVYGNPVLSIQPDIRFGRVDLDDVGGNQSSTLRVPLRVEYWNGSRFIANSDDSQTKVFGEIEDDSQVHIWPTDNSAKEVTLGDGGTVSSGSSRSITATQAESYRQQTRVWLDLDDSKNGLPWLKYNWDNKKAGEENPSSVVTFGIHRGNDRVIYRGEPGLTGQ
ncbi:DUF6701 domain-containing protein [Vibrio alginolyticus]|uniref:DUF6701 domain-containing protein n=1 Tax=unclassified Vibrio TaxID=2614977 RepID=UPI001E4EA741|nr:MULTISPECIES: DUF6701 domain-containing protein [unclassified Vibrio]EGQ9764363.1 hypothetical protein [Vibrio alginolyticus]EHI5141545.1 hypothetical protein [Vibrio alginolyticus]EJG1640217.1 hypothetical protein [Vibrio alginolyticus]EJR0952383.1 hypothetical protein [Vibrio alginolyticus]ELA9204152.1 hypothetical protein [Vibrio alginolyticus]